MNLARVIVEHLHSTAIKHHGYAVTAINNYSSGDRTQSISEFYRFHIIGDNISTRYMVDVGDADITIHSHERTAAKPESITVRYDEPNAIDRALAAMGL